MGDLFGDRAFWAELASRRGQSTVAKVMRELRKFLSRILDALYLWPAHKEAAVFYDNEKVVRQAALGLAHNAITDRAGWIDRVFAS